MEQISNLITEKMKTMAKAEDYHPLQSKRKAITTLLPYAIRLEKDGQPEMLDTFLHAARASKEWELTWHRTWKYARRLPHKASPRAFILASPHVRWYLLTDDGDLVQEWAAAASVVPYTEEVGQSVVDVLLQIMEVDELAPHIPVGMWSWLIRQPSLPPVCYGRFIGTHTYIFRAVRALKDIEILKSYLLLVWSEWGCIQDGNSFKDMCASIWKYFSGNGMGDHRAELVQRLDHILGQLDQGLDYLKQHNPQLGRYDLWRMKSQYKELKEVLLEVERCMFSLISYFSHTNSKLDIIQWFGRDVCLHIVNSTAIGVKVLLLYVSWVQ